MVLHLPVVDHLSPAFPFFVKPVPHIEMVLGGFLLQPSLQFVLRTNQKYTDRDRSRKIGIDVFAVSE